MCSTRGSRMFEGVDPYYRFVFHMISSRSFDVGGVAAVNIDNITVL